MAPDTRTRSAFAKALADAIQNRGLTLDRIRIRLEMAGVPVSSATLSYWQSGRSIPARSKSMKTLVALERILNLEPGHLLDLVSTVDDSPNQELFAWQSSMSSSEVIERVMWDLGVPSMDEMKRISTHDQLTVDSNRRQVQTVTRKLLRAETEGISTWSTVVYCGTPGHKPPRIEPRWGVKLGRFVAIPDIGAAVTELIFPRALALGETIMVEFCVHWNDPMGDCTPQLSRVTPSALQEMALAVRFAPEATPRRVELVSRLSNVSGSGSVKPLALLDDQAQHVALDVKPGEYAIRWQWDSADEIDDPTHSSGMV